MPRQAKTPKQTAVPDPATSPNDDAFLALAFAIDRGDDATIRAALQTDARWATRRAVVGATRGQATRYFLPTVMRYVMTGDTLLHVAAAGYRLVLVQQLLALGADVAAANRRGVTPLHAAAEGSPAFATWDPGAQAASIACLLAAGAPPDAPTDDGATPLHRAVRHRCGGAVRALIDGGAGVRSRNASGSTPLHLAVQTTGRGGSGSADAKAEQRVIVALLLHHGASLDDADGRGRTVSSLIATDLLPTPESPS